MQNSRLITLLKSLKPRELAQLGDLIRCQFFKIRPETAQLFQYIEKQLYPKFPEKKTEKAIIFNSIFPQKKFDDKAFRRIMGELAKCIEDYLAISSLRREEFQRQKWVGRALLERGLSAEYRRINRDQAKLLQKNKVEGVEYAMESFLLDEDLLFAPLSDTYRIFPNLAAEANDKLDRFYLLSKLRNSCELLVFSRVSGQKANLSLPSYFHEQARSLAKDQLLFDLYYRMFLLLSEGFDDQAFQDLKQLFSDHLDQLAPNDQSGLLNMLVNIIIPKVTLEGGSYVGEIFQLYQLYFDRGIFDHFQHLSPVTFLNIVISSATQPASEWTFQFIQHYRKFLPKPHRKESYKQAMAFWHFYEQEFDKTLSYVLKLQIPKNAYSLRLRSLIVRTYFELSLINDDYFDLLTSELEAYYRYLRYHEFTATSRKDSYLLFVSLTKRLANLLQRQTGIANKKRILIEEIEQTPHLVNRRWLLEKAKTS